MEATKTVLGAPLPFIVVVQGCW